MAAAKRYSKKREAILKVIQATEAHPSADWIYQQLKPEYPDLSLGTVYRNLAAFRQEGIISSVGVVKGQERFDGNTCPHCHFVCTVCGEVEDLHRVPLPEGVAEKASELYGVLIDRCHLSMEGLCSQCRSKEAQVS